MPTLVAAVLPRTAFTLALLCGAAQAQIKISGLGESYAEPFDSLAASGTSSELPAGWVLSEAGANANQTYTAGNGTANSGDTYSFGAEGEAERALGTLRSGSLIPAIGVRFTNNTGTEITSLTVSYRGEQWRYGATGRTDRLDFQYSLDATSLATGTWIDENSLDYIAAAQAAPGPVDGNANFRPVTFTITGLNIPAGADFFLRWSDFDAAGADDGLAIDDFTLEAGGEGGPSTNPSASGSASPAASGGVTTLGGTIVAGTNPPSTGLAVSCNLTAIGGSASQAIPVTGTAFRLDYAIPATVAPGTYSLPCAVTDEQSRSATFAIAVTLIALITCGAAKTSISAVQGTGAVSPMAGQTIDIEAVVTGDFQPVSRLGGFFLQEAAGDGNAATSDGIFVNDGGAGLDVNPGDLVRVRGTVVEAFNQTVLNAAGKTRCSAGNALPAPVDITFPVASVAFLERFEGMRVRFPQQLRVTDTSNLGRFNEVSLAWVPNYIPGVVFTRLMAPTQVALPGAAANAVADLNARSRIILDDASNRTYTALTPEETYPLDGGGLSASNTLRLGDRINVDAAGVHTPLTGVLGFDFASYRVHPTSPVIFNPSDNPRPMNPPEVGGRVKVASANVLNYFTTLDSRGAGNRAEFIRQRQKIINALQTMDAAVVALSEIENNTVASFEDLVNDAGPGGPFGTSLNTGNPGKWAYISTGAVGTDLIRVAFLYQPALVEPVGSHKALTNAIDPRTLDGSNRPPIAQTFRLLSGRAPALQHFTVVANHFKSKGSACAGDPDTGDGQDNCNNTRVSIAAAMLDWLATNPTGDPTPEADRRVLIVGDLNAHRMEDPVRALTAVFQDLVPALGDKAGYSYVFNGESGALDHALANPALFRLVTGAAEWHINADEPVVLDYNLDFDGNNNSQAKSARQQAAYYSNGPFRASDHDPLLIGFNPLPGDLDDDGAVGAVDGFLVATQAGQPLNAGNRRMDFDGDGAITFNDYRLWTGHYRVYLAAKP